MSPKSEENIKKRTNAKLNLNVSRKKSKTSTDNITYAKISSLKPINKDLINVEKLTIHATEKKPKVEVVTTADLETPVEEKIIEKVQIKENKQAKESKINLSKKTLKLNINRYDDNVVEKRVFTPDTTINQNSSFFYSPSVFQRYGISITSISDDNEESIQSVDSQNPELVQTIIEENNSNNEINLQQNMIEPEPVKEVAENVVPTTLEKNVTELPVQSTKDFSPVNSSSVFKAFSYEEPNLTGFEKAKAYTDSVIESQNETVSPVAKFVEVPNPTPNKTFDDSISIDMNSIDFDDNPVSSPIANTNNNSNTDTNEVLKNISFDAESVQAPVQAVVTPEIGVVPTTDTTDNSALLGNDINMDDELLEALLEDENEEDILESDDNEKNIEPETIAKETNEENSSMFDIKPDEKSIEVPDDIDYLKQPYEDSDEENDDFSIEEYFGLDNIEKDKKEEKNKKEVEEKELDKKPLIEELQELNKEIDKDLGSDDKKSLELSDSEFSSLSQLFDSFTEKISSLSNRISELEGNNDNTPKNGETSTEAPIENKQEDVSEVSTEETVTPDENHDYIENFINENSVAENDTVPEAKETVNDLDINLDDISLEDLDINTDDLIEEDIKDNTPAAIIDNSNDTQTIDEAEIEGILSQTFSGDNSEIDESMRQELLNEVLLSSDDESLLPISDEDSKDDTSSEATDDFFTVIDTLTKTISQLEGNDNPGFASGNGKSINILIDQDDIFSISILNETYEIVSDFDGISVLSENIHISTPKKNFYVTVGEKYIEIHNVGKEFTVNTNFEDIEFANALNNVTFAKKNNIIELNIKEAFKLSSVNNKVELSMLNKSIAEIKKSNVEIIEASETVNESSICDNRTLLISEETQKVYLPYTIEELMQKLNDSHEYQTLEDVVENEYTVPLSTFKMPIISRFKEAYKFMRTKEHSSVYAALDLAVELMFNSNLNPAVIRACKDLKELNVYLDCLYENEIEKFDCFKIVYKVLPKIQ